MPCYKGSASTTRARASCAALRLSLVSLLLLAGCAKKLPSGPGTPPGTPVILGSITFVSKSRPVTISGLVHNQSGYTIYNVQIEMTVYRSYPTYANFTDTSDIQIVSLDDGQSAPFTYSVYGDQFISADAVWSYLPYGP
jgi:hypothetical protein